MNNILKMIVVLIFGLAGCTTEEGQVDTIEYASLSGNVNIPSEPKRIVTDYYCGDLLALETNVVGCDLTYKSPSWDVSGITDIGQSTEQIAGLNPDLIITFNAENYEVYKELAPTILIPYGSYNEENLLKELAVITNTVDKGDQLLGEFNDKVTKLKEGLAKSYSLDKTTFSTIESWGEDVYAYGNTWSRFGYVMYDKMGLKPPVKAQEKLISDKPSGETYLLLTEELVSDYVGDVVLVGTKTGENDNNPIINSSSFQNTAAAKTGNVFYVNSELFYNNDILSLLDQIDIIQELVNEAK